MSSDAIIAGLKQGNAIELGVLKDMKEGFVALADGMINECLNRSDGLDELTDKLQLEPTATTATTLTADQKLHLTKAINDAISACEQAIITNNRKEEMQVEQAKTRFAAEAQTRNVLVNHLNEQIRIHNKRNLLMVFMPEKHDIHDSLTELRAEEKQHLDKLRHSYKNAVKDAAARNSSQLKEIAGIYEHERNEFRKQIASLERIAIIAKLDLKATSRDEASDHVSIQEPQAAHISIASSPVGRGSRGSFSSRGSVHSLSGRGMLGARGGRGSFQSRPTDPFPSIPDSQTLTVDYLRPLSRGNPSPWNYQG
ncbi:hypothetical protein J4E90_000311 [Alternaria incomplexa]|uniref:uncharacterized protein n=1 Tax=Alternaria incomplexa TaxID=1187928 RepID=UPI00221EAA97|nr:uncharacterized protein J4E90_000311 [Alternaria incomplexa]KAI4921883.1 hypothetical protein J4E90_000311 [Alternaria incomplexa]